MEIVRNIPVPTGNILIVRGEHGLLECLSLGDYGKDVNLNQGRAVNHTRLLPLEDKWVVTISTQYGCSMGCTYCDVPKVGKGKNATLNDMVGQVKAALSLHPEVEYTKRLNVHFARMGEPSWNDNVLAAAMWLNQFGHKNMFHVHPVVSTMMPNRNRHLWAFLREWRHIKNVLYEGEAGLQLSINSTDESERRAMFNGNACKLSLIANLMQGFVPIGRKITLNFAVADWEINPAKLLRWFGPAHYVVKLTPMHLTARAESNGIRTAGDYTEPYPYEHHAEALRRAGYDVLVFIASREEDEGRITCGNAILSGTEPFGAGVASGAKP